jgi:hypothetical protein
MTASRVVLLEIDIERPRTSVATRWSRRDHSGSTSRASLPTRERADDHIRNEAS